MLSKYTSKRIFSGFSINSVLASVLFFLVLSSWYILRPIRNDMAAQNEDIMNYIKTKQPLDGGRIGHANDVTSMAALLLSDHASFITGQNIAVDGGWSVSEGQHPL